MPRLDRWLRDNGHFTSRQRAKRAIKKGLVLVNGKQAKPSTHVTEMDEIHISEKAKDIPIGYLKIEKIDSLIADDLVSSDDFVLDIGSSAGGFIRYAREQGARIIGIEIADEFISKLEDLASHSDNISILQEDAFTIPLEQIPCGDFSKIFIDVTAEPDSTIRLVERFSKCLCYSGMILAAFKSKPTAEIIQHYCTFIEEIGFVNPRSIVLENQKDEFHIIAVKNV